jgi:phosphinothricin acetyltransferase
MNERLRIDNMETQDWDEVRSIYLEGIATNNATFETDVPEWDVWDGAHLSVCRLVAREGDTVVGWAALSRVSARDVYAGVAEVSVYVTSSKQRRGIAGALLRRLITEAEREGIWTLQAGIFPENIASIKLHEHAGFREVGRRERIGRLKNVWRDVVLLERRSKVVGTETN